MALSTKNRIIQGTAELLIREGFSFISVDTISQFLGISKKTLYNHFESKYAIYAEAFAWDIENIYKGLESIISLPEPDFMKKISKVLHFGYQEIQNRSKLISESSLGKIPLSILHEYRDKMVNILLLAIRRLIEEADAKGLKKTNLSNEILSYAILVLVEGNIFHRDRLNPVDRMDLFFSSIQLLLAGSMNI